MEFTAREIASFLGGEIVGDPGQKITGVSKIDEGKPETLSFLSNLKYSDFLYTTKASVVLVNDDFIPARDTHATLIKVPDAYAALSKLLELYVQSLPKKTGTEHPVYISPSASIGNDVYLGAFAYIGDHVRIQDRVSIHPHVWIGDGATIGNNTILYSGVKIYPHTQIGNNCILHAGSVIGSDGFGFAPLPDGTYKKIPQIGNVILEDDVEIGANTTIDCATMGSTKIQKGVKIDNLVQIGHNVVVGENTVLAGQTGIAGSSTIGKNCVMAGQVGIAGHLKIGEKVTIGAKTGISKNIPAGKTYLGSYGMEASRYLRAYAVFRNLPDLFNDIHDLKKKNL
ncbi:MAG TPA: UDP-3-O-(3-hydroxymyristoyl)glucosamine N-acyltransferase [Prolixibacteraceae bacterium]|nr:UDP-3-O-(3-hydroxymyristoyl)glucosamine N-acyltransferase [Prolixibacteraceae bacterium]